MKHEWFKNISSALAHGHAMTILELTFKPGLGDKRKLHRYVHEMTKAGLLSRWSIRCGHCGRASFGYKLRKEN